MAVVNDSTSTTTTTRQAAASTRAPALPHSRRASKPAWSKMVTTVR
jgi:hypothetical protein